MIRSVFYSLLITFLFNIQLQGQSTYEGAFVIDSDKKILRSLIINKELTIDHISTQGFEVYGPKGTLDFLKNHRIAHYDLAKSQRRGIDNAYPTPEEIENQIYDLNKRFPELTQVIEIGRSVQGRKLLVLKISNNPMVDEVKPEFKYISSMHGDEITGRELMVQFAKELLESYYTNDEVRSFIDATEIFIMASMNPDGSARRMRGNANYVDLNRNFPDFSTSDNQNTPNGRQPETQHIMNFQKQRQFALSANFHGGAEVMNYAWDTIREKHPFYDLLVFLSLEYANRVPYISNSSEFPKGITNGYAWYEVNGGMQDWSYYWHNDLQFTVELSNSKWPNYSKIPYYYEQNKEALLKFASYIHMGAGFKIDKANINGTVRVYQVGEFGTKDLGTYKFHNSEFYKVLQPGSYYYEIEGNGIQKQTVRVEITNQAEKFVPNYVTLQ